MVARPVIRRPVRLAWLWLGCAGLALSACDGADVPGNDAGTETAEPAPSPTPPQSSTDENEMISADDGDMAADLDLPGGTPMAERVATIGLLNKRNNITRDITLSPGEQERVDDVVIRLRACERTAPWEAQPETGAFVQFLTKTPESDDDNPRFRRVFSGWLFKNSPSLNVVEHPIYDVWVKDCAMSFPGEEEPETSEE
ncbi:DUF2155 domain-containing protein [Croceicoccus hydrothermalis]|uniref:DUF2155 domain-containing protein n=1 Tax=Croceicoccus hydrothermalis TaxID=2867964 RepID=UPI001EFC2903|nr:DUF2155 domain-containing protein [Croceicoccus hydrothermalis]